MFWDLVLEQNKCFFSDLLKPILVETTTFKMYVYLGESISQHPATPL